MNFIARHINAIGILLLMTFAAAAAGLYWNVPQQSQKSGMVQTSAKQPNAPTPIAIERQQPVAGSATPGSPTAEAGCPMHRNKSDSTSPAPSAEAGCNHSEDSGDGCCKPKESAVPSGSGCTRNARSPATSL